MLGAPDPSKDDIKVTLYYTVRNDDGGVMKKCGMKYCSMVIVTGVLRVFAHDAG